jgi:hypothetical protein
MQAEEAEEAAEEEGGEEEEEEDASGELPELIQARHIIVEEGFLEDPDQLRSVFAERFEDPRKTSRSRFLWDWWHVPNQYTLVRTQVSLQTPWWPQQQRQPVQMTHRGLWQDSMVSGWGATAHHPQLLWSTAGPWLAGVRAVLCSGNMLAVWCPCKQHA